MESTGLLSKSLYLVFRYAYSVLSCRAYSFQTFAVLEVLGASKMNQIEVNVRDHVHGRGNVVGLMQTMNYDMVPLTGPNTVTWDAGSGHMFTLVASAGAGGKINLANPTSPKSGGFYSLRVTHGNSGGNDFVYGSAYKFPLGIAASSGQLSTSSGAVDLLQMQCWDGSSVMTTLLKGLANSGQVV